MKMDNFLCAKSFHYHFHVKSSLFACFIIEKIFRYSILVLHTGVGNVWHSEVEFLMIKLLA